MKTRHKNVKAQQNLVEAWKDVPEGTPVIVTKDRGEQVQTKTASGPFLLGGHTACIMLEGISGAYSLERVRKEVVIACKKSDVDEGVQFDDLR